ncbi:MAG TPA: biotin/lipoyl-binding protein [Clostridia bacterium]|nr:biotin/lipoyl-binding protein [Clostridia bacterium]
MKRSNILNKLLILSCIFLLLLPSGCSYPADPQTSAGDTLQGRNETIASSSSQDAVPTITASYQTIQNTIKLGGIFQRSKTCNVSFSVSGYEIAKVYVNAGDEVKKGDLLAELDTTALAREKMKKELEREKVLVGLEELSVSEAIDGKKDMNARKVAQLDLQALELDMQELGQRMSACKLLSPADGIVGELDVKAGSISQAYRPVIRIYGISDMVFLADNIYIRYDDFVNSDRKSVHSPAGIVRGLKSVINYGTGGTSSIPCTIDRITYFTYRTATAATISLQAALDGSVPSEITEGTEGVITLNTGIEKKALAVPRGSLYVTFGEEHVKVLENNKAVERLVKSGLRDDAQDLVEITDGLSEGDKVLLNPSVSMQTMD